MLRPYKPLLILSSLRHPFPRHAFQDRRYRSHKFLPDDILPEMTSQNYRGIYDDQGYLTLPQEVMDYLQVSVGDQLEFIIESDGAVEIRKSTVFNGNTKSKDPLSLP